METSTAKNPAPDSKKQAEDKRHTPWNSSPWMTLTAWAVLIGIAAALIIMLMMLYQKNPMGSDAVNHQKGKQVRAPNEFDPLSGQNAPGLPGSGRPTSAEDSLRLNLPPQSSFINPDSPPAVSAEPIETSAPMLKFMPLSVTLSNSRPTAYFEIRNDGNADLIYNLSTNNSLISVSPTYGTLKSNQRAKITVTGYTEGIVVIDSNGGYDAVTVKFE